MQSEQNTKLNRSYLNGAGANAVRRHRGKPPRQAAYFTRSVPLRQETDVLVSVCCLLGLIDPVDLKAAPAPAAQIPRAQLLCQAYECYRQMISTPHISLDHTNFLLTALALGRELRLTHCAACGAIIVADLLALRLPRCVVCASAAIR